MRKKFDTDLNNDYYLNVAQYVNNNRLYIGISNQVDDLVTDITINLPDVEIESNNQIFLSADIQDDIKVKLIDKGIISKIDTTQKYNMGEYQIAYIDFDALKKYDSKGVDEFLNNQKKEKDNLFNFYDKEEIKKLLKDKIKLVYIDNGSEEVVARYEDLPDIIVDINEKLGHNENLTVYDLDTLFLNKPILTTFGYYLDKCDSNVRKDIIDRLTGLQFGEFKIKDYKMIDEDMLNDVKIEMEQEEMEK